MTLEDFPRSAATERFDHKIIINNLFTIVNRKKILGIVQDQKTGLRAEIYIFSAYAFLCRVTGHPEESLEVLERLFVLTPKTPGIESTQIYSQAWNSVEVGA